MIALIQELIRMESVSGSEKKIADFIYEMVGPLGGERRANNVLWRGEQHPDRKTIALGAHLDTVPFDAAQWKVTHPLEPVIHDGKLYGRGACDMKAGAGILLDLLMTKSYGERFNVRFFWYEKEELGVPNGVTDLIRSGFFDEVDLCIIPEPTETTVNNGVFGNLDARIIAKGKAAHSAYPLLGDNAIYRMLHVIEKIRNFHCDEIDGVREAISVNTIHGGHAINVVPDKVIAEMDYRFHPGKPETEVLNMLSELEDPYIRTEVIGLHPGVLHRIESHPLIRQLSALAGEHRVVPFWSDIGQLGASGIPAVNFGPGSIAQAHTIDEYVIIDQVHFVREVLHNFLTTWNHKL